jgi:hypothetical protein
LGAAANRAAAREKKRSEPAKTTAQAAGGDDETRVAKLDSAEDVAHERPLESEDSPTQDVVIPPGRPAWVESEPAEAGDVYTWPVSSGVQLSKQACRRALDEKLQAATRQYLDQILGRNNASAWVDYDTPYIRAHLLRPENIYHEVIQTSVGPVHQSHGLLEFDDSFRQQSQERWSELRATSRLLQVGLGAGLVLGVVGAFFAFFRLDTATRGYYTRRLQLAVAGAILTMIAAGVLLARCIPWI